MKAERQEPGSGLPSRGTFTKDYQKAFGDEPPPISGVAVMTDTDNTQESAVAYYGDITFKKE